MDKHEPGSHIKILWFELNFTKESVAYRSIVITLCLTTLVLIFWILKESVLPAIAIKKVMGIKLGSAVALVKAATVLKRTASKK